MIPKVKPGDTIAIFTPAWKIKSKKKLLNGIKEIQSFGFKVFYNDSFKEESSVAKKIKEFNSLIKTPEVNMLLAVRGGYGSIKLLDGIDYDAIKKNPKVIAGFSDLTAILNVVCEKTGVITFHSPMVINFADATEFTENSFINAITGFSKKNLFSKARVYIIKNGLADGTLKGGNLITLSSLIGTPWEIKIENSILFLEEVEEKPHSIDRWLTNLIISKKLKKIKGLILGDFRGCRYKDVFGMIKSLMKVDFPVVYTPNIGHVRNKITLPVGARVRLNTYKKELLLIQ